MPDTPLLQFARDLEWLGCELEHYGGEHALAGFPNSGPRWDAFREKQRGVVATADKVERALKGLITYDPSRLVGVEFPLDESLDAISSLLRAVEEIKHCSVFAVQFLPERVRAFTRMIQEYLEATGKVRA